MGKIGLNLTAKHTGKTILFCNFLHPFLFISASKGEVVTRMNERNKIHYHVRNERNKIHYHVRKSKVCPASLRILPKNLVPIYSYEVRKHKGLDTSL